MIFSHYGFKDHVTDKCYKLYGYPPGYKSRNSNNNVENAPRPTLVNFITQNATPSTYHQTSSQAFLLNKLAN